MVKSWWFLLLFIYLFWILGFEWFLDWFDGGVELTMFDFYFLFFQINKNNGMEKRRKKEIILLLEKKFYSHKKRKTIWLYYKKKKVSYERLLDILDLDFAEVS